MEEDASNNVELHRFKAFDLPLSSVTVFSDRAEVERIVKADFKTGFNEIFIEAVSKSIVPDSIRVGGHSEATIHRVQFHCRPADKCEMSSPKVKQVEDELKTLVEAKLIAEDRQKIIKQKVEALDQLMTKTTSSVVEKDKGFTFDDSTFEGIKKLMEFYEHNSADVRAESRSVALEIEELGKKMNKLNAELQEIRNDISKIRIISILMESKKEIAAEIVVSYQVWNAHWVPTYDIRVTTNEDGKGMMKVSYYGKIEQNSGEDWINTKLILSTAQPALGGDLPSLGTVEARFKRPVPVPPHNAVKLCSAKVAMDGTGKSGLFGYQPYNADMAVSNVTTSDTVMSTIFEITRLSTIPSDSSEHRVVIAVVDLSPTLAYTTIPSKSTNVFLLSSLVNESIYPFLAGEASVYFNNSFIAKTVLKSVSPGESFDCCLGVDPAIRVEYKPLHKYTEQVGLITKNSCVAHERKIVLKNTKKDDIVLTVKELIPKSTDEKIKIRLISPQLTANAGGENSKTSHTSTLGAYLNKQNHLEWTLKLEPNKETELLIKYAVEHPSNETVVFNEVF